MSVNVKHVKGRRKVHFECYDDIRRDAEMLHRSGPLKCLGNWTAGQNYEHLAKSIDVSIDGVDYKLPLWMQWIAKAFKNWFLNRPFKPGFNLPVKLEPAFYPREIISDEDGFRLLIVALDRIQSNPHRAASPAFGEMPESDWIKLHCRHSELHLSFLLPANNFSGDP
jgi:Protein of unknown function (DUF1569)